MKIILGSKSPRRQALVQEIGLPVEVRVQEVDEIYPDDLSPRKVPEFLSQIKAEPLVSNLSEDEILLTSDTIVLINGEILGKPTDFEDAKKILKKLSGEEHEVITGYTLQTNNQKVTESCVTKVQFNDLNNEEIEHYLTTYQPYDKAGSYGIQEWIGYIGISGIEGCYYNVMGLPVSHIYNNLKNNFNIKIR